jgi:hypothetical protein
VGGRAVAVEASGTAAAVEASGTAGGPPSFRKLGAEIGFAQGEKGARVLKAPHSSFYTISLSPAFTTA